MNDHIMKIKIQENPKATFIIYPRAKSQNQRLFILVYEAASTIKTIRLQEL